MERIEPDRMHDLWSDPGRPWPWGNPFTTPAWLDAWWRSFGTAGDREPLLLRFDTGGRTAGVAPLMRENGCARFMGSDDLCDHGDFPGAPERRDAVFRALLRDLRERGIRRVSLSSVRPDSAAARGLVPAARAVGCRVSVRPAGTTMEMELPDTWEDYLGGLSGKQRHEVRRKLRRAAEAGRVSFRNLREPGEASEAMDLFFRLFRKSRPEKDRFLTPGREAFFRALAGNLAREGMLALSVLDLDHRPAAAAFCVELEDTTYLYNSGFDAAHGGLSIGTVSKLTTIRRSIEAGRRVYDFLNGTERYKYRLGGKEVALSRIDVEL